MVFQQIFSNIKDLNLNFIGGELAKSHWGNISASFYSTSAKIAENMIGLATGGMRKRLGTILLEKSETEIITYNWENHDLLFKKLTDNSLEYKVYKNNVVVKDWTTLSGFDWNGVYNMTILLSRSEDMLLGTKNGLYKMTTADYTLTLQAINNPDARTITDFSNAVIFNDSLVTFDKGYIYSSRFTSFLDFKPDTGSAINVKSPSFAPVSVFEANGQDLIATKTINNYIVVATTHGIYVVRRSLTTSTDPPTYYTTFIADYIALPGGVIIIGGSIYIGTEDGIFIIGADEFDQISETGGIGTASKNNSYRATTFKLYSITVFCEHVFSKDPNTKMIAYTKRSVSNPDIIYGIRKDGIVICFALVQALVKGSGLQAPITTRRTCKGIYHWLCPDTFATSVTIREIAGDKKDYFVEKEIYRNYCDDNQSTYANSDFKELDKYLFFDCGFIANGIKNYTALFKNSLLRTDKNTGYKVGDHIIIIVNNMRTSYAIDAIDSASNNFYDFITLRMPAHNPHPLVEGNTYFIRGKLIGDSVKLGADYLAYKAKVADVIDIQEFSHNLAHDGTVAPNSKLNLSTFNYSSGIDYQAYLRVLHATITTRIERLSMGVTSLETQFATVKVAETSSGNTEDTLTANNTTVSYTNYYEYDLPSITGYQTIKNEIELRAAPGDNMIILNISYTITKSVYQS